MDISPRGFSRVGKYKVDKDENDVALTLRDKRFNDVIARAALELTGQLNWKGHLNSVTERVLQELKESGGTLLLQLGLSPSDGYVPSSDEEAKEKILYSLKKRVKEYSTGLPKANPPAGKRRLEDQSEKTPRKKQVKIQSTWSEETHMNEGHHSYDSQMVDDKFNPTVSRVVNLTIGEEEFRYLWNQIKDGLRDAKCHFEENFYGHLKQYFSTQSDQNKCRVLLSDVEKLKNLLNRFETTMKELCDNTNDDHDIRLYGNWIKGIIGDAEENLPLSE